MEELSWTARRQGDLGETSALTRLIAAGAFVSIPLGHSSDYDLVADFGDRPERIQVKTSTPTRKNRWDVAVCTRGGNQSWSGLVKRLDPTRYDRLFVHVGDGRRWFIPAARVEAGNIVRLGGPKYADWEIEPGEPLPTLRR